MSRRACISEFLNKVVTITSSSSSEVKSKPCTSQPACCFKTGWQIPVVSTVITTSRIAQSPSPIAVLYFLTADYVPQSCENHLLEALGNTLGDSKRSASINPSRPTARLLSTLW